MGEMYAASMPAANEDSCPPSASTVRAKWVGDDRTRLDTPSHVRWNGDQLCNYSHYGYEFGLKDLLPPTHADNIQHFIVVPKVGQESGDEVRL